MIRQFCIRLDAKGIPDSCRLMKRKFRSPADGAYEANRLRSRGWTQVIPVDADNPLILQAAQWAASLLRVNPRYVLEPSALWYYLKGPNWNDPGVDYAHYEEYVKAIGTDLWQEFSGYRGVPLEEAVRRMAWLLLQIGISVQEGRP